MKILLCNERFLFRFGVDRVLMILGVYFKRMGHQVIMMGNKLDEQAVEICTDRFIQVPEAPDYFDSNEYVRGWLETQWDSLFPTQEETPDLAFVAGWPFYLSLDFFKEKCGACIFHDYGAVDTDGMEGGQLLTQQKLKKLRNDNLSKADKIIAISHFLEETQSKADAKGLIPTSYVHLGTDHMAMNLWSNSTLGLAKSKLVEQAEQLKAEGCKLIFSLGRYEVGNYKNSPQAFELLRNLKQKYSGKIKLLLLARKEELDLPKDIKDDVIPLGFVSDDDLDALMGLCDIGICMSLWEGFNLPLAEMQLKERPVFVFNAGAHPEVVIDPWYLCNDLKEMSNKTAAELRGKGGLEKKEFQTKLKKYMRYFTWENCALNLMEEFEALFIEKKQLLAIMDVTNASHDTANTGVMRVTRHIAKNLQDRMPVLFALWDSSIQEYVLPYEQEVELLCNYGGPQKELVTHRSQHGCPRSLLKDTLPQYNAKQKFMMIVETINENTAKLLRRYAHENGMKIAAVFHDAIPVRYPHFCNDEVTQNHKAYMYGLAECDLILPNSDASKRDLLKFWEEENIEPTAVHTDTLPGELEGVERCCQSVLPSKKNAVQMLCISTLEPRKNHKRLINACMLLAERRPDINWELTLIGNRYAGNDEIPAFVQNACKKEPRIKWLGVVDDETLFKAYAKADFTVYPSIIEGFGMPIMESLWNGKPCMCSKDNVMGELAEEGGCLTVDVEDEESIFNGLVSLATDAALREKLTLEATKRHIRTWKDYALTLVDEVLGLYNVKAENKLTKADQFFFYNQNCGESDLDYSAKLALLSILNGKYFDQAICFGETTNSSILANNVPLVYQISENEYEGASKNVYTLENCPKDVLPVLQEEIEKANQKISLVYFGRNYALKQDAVAWFESAVLHGPLVIIEEVEADHAQSRSEHLAGLTLEKEFVIPSNNYHLAVSLYA